MAAWGSQTDASSNRHETCVRPSGLVKHQFPRFLRRNVRGHAFRRSLRSSHDVSPNRAPLISDSYFSAFFRNFVIASSFFCPGPIS
jgi:hypothetical protein